MCWVVRRNAVRMCVHCVDVFLSKLWISVVRREETGLSVGWDRIRGTSVESGVGAEM